MADHPDYLPGELPAIHSPTHANGGVDEISLAGLSGVSAELATHAALPTVHQDAPALIGLHAAIAAAHHVKYTDAEVAAIANGLIAAHTAISAAHHARYTDGEAEAVADTQIAIHAALPTVHQDAPALILTHKGDPVAHQDAPSLIATHAAITAAHHAKYTDAEARASLSPIIIPALSFLPGQDDTEYIRAAHYIHNRTSLLATPYFAPVFFPNGVTVTKITIYGYRNDNLANIMVNLSRSNMAGSQDFLTSLVADWFSGWSSMYDDSISYSLIDNTSYAYLLSLSLNPNDDVGDVRLSGVKIDFTG